MLLTALSAPP